jgi:hypothetical protein
LARAFAGSDGIFVERELHTGFSGARVLLTRPGAGLAQIVVKIGPPTDLQREWTAYRTLVADYSPQNTARIQEEPILSDDGQQALLRYTFAGGDPRHSTCSLRTYYQEQGGGAAAEVLNRVIRIYGRQWWSQNVPRTFALSQEYDRLLPVHLKVKSIATSDSEAFQDVNKSVTLTAGEANIATVRTLPVGQSIQLVNFTINEIRQDKRELTLTAPPPKGEASADLRIRIEGINLTSYSPGDRVSALDGEITATCQSLLVTGAQPGLAALDLEAETVHLGEKTLPNPLRDYTKLLEHVTDSRFSIIHGDLNLENILVDSDTGFAWLIDFADTRRGPALFDLQRLEGQVITKLLPPLMSRLDPRPELIVDLYQALHADSPVSTAPNPDLQEPYTLLVAIRRLARQYLINDIDWDEYYRGLTLTLLGTLKFAELEAPGRALAFTGAAVANGLIGVPLPETSPVSLQPKSTAPRRWPVIVTLIFLLTIVTIVTGWLWWQNPSTEEHSPLGLIASLIGRVEVRRQATDRVQPATFGLDLFSEDAVLTYEGAAANVLCRNGLLFKLGPGHIMVVRCRETDGIQAIGRLDPQLSAQLVSATEGITLTLAPAGTRTARIEFEQNPTLISPRNTAITETLPTWRWEDINTSEGYQLTVVNAVTGQRWQAETADTELVYPVDAPSLVPNTTYLTQLKPIQPIAQVDESFFFLLDDAGRARVATTEVAIRALSLDPMTTAYLLAEYYQTQELYGAAINQLESIADEKETPGLAGNLGDLYFQVGLHVRAETNYQAALAEAEATEDPAAQARARVGLGRVADAYGETEAAISHFQAADALYRSAGDLAHAEAVAQILAELMDNATTTTPAPSPTP